MAHSAQSNGTVKWWMSIPAVPEQKIMPQTSARDWPLMHFCGKQVDEDALSLGKGLYNGSPCVGKDVLYSAVPLKRGEVSTKSSQKTPRSSPVRARFWVSSVKITSDAYFNSVIVMPYEKYCYVGPRYNGTRLYVFYCRAGPKWSDVVLSNKSFITMPSFVNSI